ncbi:MAG: hypothetical protein LBM21_01715, partial [Coriobacteriales bacterium]|nr:hypothetical protein [Coriobacteriales bacterium]
MERYNGDHSRGRGVRRLAGVALCVLVAAMMSIALIPTGAFVAARVANADPPSLPDTPQGMVDNASSGNDTSGSVGAEAKLNDYAYVRFDMYAFNHITNAYVRDAANSTSAALLPLCPSYAGVQANDGPNSSGMYLPQVYSYIYGLIAQIGTIDTSKTAKPCDVAVCDLGPNAPGTSAAANRISVTGVNTRTQDIYGSAVVSGAAALSGHITQCNGATTYDTDANNQHVDRSGAMCWGNASETIGNTNRIDINGTGSPYGGATTSASSPLVFDFYYDPSAVVDTANITFVIDNADAFMSAPDSSVVDYPLGFGVSSNVATADFGAQVDADDLPDVADGNGDMVFDGWYENTAVPSFKWTDGTVVPTYDVTLTAKWTPVPFISMSDFVYDGTVSAYSGYNGVQLGNPTGGSAIIYYGNDFNEDGTLDNGATWSTAQPVCAGHYVIKADISATQAYPALQTSIGTYSIEPRNISVATGSYSGGYDGRSHNNPTIVISGLPTSAWTYYASFPASIIDVGTVTNTYLGLMIKDPAGNVVSNDNFNITDYLGTLALAPGPYAPVAPPTT